MHQCGNVIHKVWFIHMIDLTVIVISKIDLKCFNMDELHTNVDSEESFSMIPRTYYHLCTFITHIRPYSMRFMAKYMCIKVFVERTKRMETNDSRLIVSGKGRGYKKSELY